MELYFVGADLIYGPQAMTHLTSLMCTVNCFLGLTTACRSSDADEVPLANHSFSESRSSNLPAAVFYMSFTRRGGVSLEHLFEAAAKYNLDYEIMEDYTFDIFGNNVDVDSLFWSDVIVAFRRRSDYHH